jgi:monofunctional biosynthetic peptidoglycan transglycosylase
MDRSDELGDRIGDPLTQRTCLPSIAVHPAEVQGYIARDLPPPRPMPPSGYGGHSDGAPVPAIVCLLQPPLPMAPSQFRMRTVGPSSLIRPVPAGLRPSPTSIELKPPHFGASPVAQAELPAVPGAFDVAAMARSIPATGQPFQAPVDPLIADAAGRISASSALAPAAMAPERHWLVRMIRIAGLVAVAWLAAVLLLIIAYRFINPPLSALMVQQRLSGQEITQDWVALDDVSSSVIRAVVLSEDGRFCSHSGVDFDAMQAAIERAADGAPRGASTISMQVTKNLFLWPSKSYVRKAIEIPLTYVIETLWPKRRILEVYLNIAEWGPGIFGVEAASQYHFGKSAARLSEREAARLAVALPNPYTRDAGDPGPRTLRLASDIQGRMRSSPASQLACVAGGE